MMRSSRRARASCSESPPHRSAYPSSTPNALSADAVALGGSPARSAPAAERVADRQSVVCGGAVDGYPWLVKRKQWAVAAVVVMQLQMSL